MSTMVTNSFDDAKRSQCAAIEPCSVPKPSCLTGREATITSPYAGQSPPKAGDWIYTPTLMSISHGVDDVAGGLAQVTKVESTDYNGGDHWISVAQHSRRLSWNVCLRDQQQKLRERYGAKLAHSDPDYNDYDSDSGWRSFPGRGYWP